MKAVAPKPTSPASLWLTGKTVEQRTQEGKQMYAALAGKSFFDALKEGVDTYNNATAKAFMGQNAPAEGGITGNRYVDFAASLATMGAAIKIGVQVVGGLVSAINFTREMNSKWNWPTVEGGVASNDLAVRVAQANPGMDEETANSISSLVARTGGNTAQLNALASNASTLSRSLNQISLASQNPSAQTVAQNIVPSAVRTIAQTGIFQSIPMPAGLVHSTAPAIPMGNGTLPAPTVVKTPAPVVAPAVLYHGTREASTIPFINANGDLVLNPSENFGGKQVGVSLTPVLGTAKDYATRNGGAGMIFEIDHSALPVNRLKVQAADEIQVSGDEPVVIPKGSYRIIGGSADQTELTAWSKKTEQTVAKMSDKALAEQIVLAAGQGEATEGMDEGAALRPANRLSADIVAKYGSIPEEPFYLEELTNRINASPNRVAAIGKFKQLLSAESNPARVPYDVGDEIYALIGEQKPAQVVPPVKAVPITPSAFRDAITPPRAIDHTIPTIDVKKANLVDVTAKVDLKSVQVQHPTATNVVLDTKRRVVMFTNGTTPLEAMGVDKPQLKEWYGIEGNKLLGEVTQPAPTISKMETPAVQIAPIPPSVSPPLSTTPQIGTATTILNQKTSISTSPPVSPQGEAKTGASVAKWGKWIDAVGSRRTDGVGGGDVATIKTPMTYRLASGTESVRAYSPTTAAEKGIAGPFIPETGKRLELKGDSHTYYLTRLTEEEAKAEGLANHSASLATSRPFSVIEARSGNLIGQGATVKDAIGRAQETINNNKAVYDGKVEEQVVAHGEIANPASVPASFLTSTSAPAAAPSLGNASPAHGLIDYSTIELNGTTSVTSPAVLKSVSNTGKGFDNYIQNTAGTKDTSLSGMAKFKEGRDLQVRRYENQFDGLMKTPAGAEWMTMAIEADEVLREEYAHPFYIDETGNKVPVEGEFAPAILNRQLKQYGPNYGKFLQHLQRAGIPIEATAGLDPDKMKLAQQHIDDARMSLVNFQKNEPQLFVDYMAAAQELGKANALLPEFYRQFLSPETYANEKAHPNYYVSLSAGRTDIFDRGGVAPLERTHGLTELDKVVEPLPGLLAVYRDAIRAQGINNAKREAVRSNKNSEVATTVLSDSVVHLKENGVDRAYDVHDTNVTKSVHNLTLAKPEVPTWEKWLVKSPTTALRLFATGLNPAFGLYNIMRDSIQGVGTVPFTPKGLVKGTIRAFKSPGLSQWFDSYRDPMMSKGTRAIEALKTITSIITYPNEIGESLTRSVIAESILDRGGTYLDQLHGYFASTGFFALHGTFFNDFIPSCIPFTRATIAVMRVAYRNTFFGLPIGDKGGTFSRKQGAEKLAGRNLATIIFALVSALAIKEAGKEKEYKLLRDRASYFYFPTPSGGWVKLPVPIGFQPIKAATDYVLGYKGDPLDIARQAVSVLPGPENFFLPPALNIFLQYRYNLNFFTGAAVTAAVGTPPANPLEAALMKTGMDEGQAAFLVRSFLADIPSQVQYVFDMVGQGTSTQASPLTKRFIVKDPTTSSNAAVDDFYALVDATSRSSNAALKHFVNGRASAIGQLIHNAKTYPADAKVYMTTATDNIIMTFATIAENPETYGIKKFGPFSWRPKGNYEELAP
jgi:hypothetical protein